MKKFWTTGFIALTAQLLFSEIALSQGSRFVVDYSNAQQFMQDISSKPIYLRVEYNVEGTPFYPDDYYKANIYIKNGRVYMDVYVKFNLQENLVLFKMPDGTELSATSPVERVVFTDAGSGGMMLNKTFENGFPAVDKQNETTYYEVMEIGKVKLLKYHSVIYNDKRYYGQASITRIFDQKETCYLCFANGTVKKIEKGKEALLSLLADKRNELVKFIDHQKLKCRNENDWQKVIAYYNSLFRDT